MTITDNQLKVSRIMVIDDDDINNFLCDRVIRTADVAEEVDTFTSAHDALEHLKKALRSEDNGLPDLILLDINMPLMDGWEFLGYFEKMLEKIDKPIYVAVLSSSVYRKDQDKASQFDCVVDYISKPLTVPGITEILKRIQF